MQGFKVISLTVAILALIGTPVGIWVGMQVTNARQDTEIKNLKEDVVELRAQNEALKTKVDQNRTYFISEMETISAKIDCVPQKVFDLINSVNQLHENE